MPTIFSSLLFLTNIAVILLPLAIGGSQVANAVSVQLFAESGCPADNPGPICTNLPELTCCKDHVGDIANYYTSAFLEGLRDDVSSAWTWNFESKCAQQELINYYKVECFETRGSKRDGYGVYWATYTYGQPLPLPTARTSVNGSASVAGLGDSLAECKGSVAPDIYHIKLSAGSPAIPIARKVALKMMAFVTGVEQVTDALDMRGFVDRDTGVVKGEKLSIVQQILAKDGDGLTMEQNQALKKLRR